jgi:hypothetical protein
VQVIILDVHSLHLVDVKIVMFTKYGFVFVHSCKFGRVTLLGVRKIVLLRFWNAKLSRKRIDNHIMIETTIHNEHCFASWLKRKYHRTEVGCPVQTCTEPSPSLSLSLALAWSWALAIARTWFNRFRTVKETES